MLLFHQSFSIKWNWRLFEEIELDILVYKACFGYVIHHDLLTECNENHWSTYTCIHTECINLSHYVSNWWWIRYPKHVLQTKSLVPFLRIISNFMLLLFLIAHILPRSAMASCYKRFAFVAKQRTVSMKSSAQNQTASILCTNIPIPSIPTNNPVL